MLTKSYANYTIINKLILQANFYVYIQFLSVSMFASLKFK